MGNLSIAMLNNQRVTSQYIEYIYIYNRLNHVKASTNGNLMVTQLINYSYILHKHQCTTYNQIISQLSSLTK